MAHDVFFKKEVALEHEGQALRFRVAQDLFSSHEVDVGTRRLLRTLAGVEAGTLHKVLDLGCGYGPLGLALKKADQTRVVHMVDRDALAVDYARQNAALNHLADVQVYGSLGYDDVQAVDFDLIVSNIPGKAGQPVIAHLLRDACFHLSPGGLAAVVVVAPLESAVAEALDGPGVEILFRETRSGHAVFHYRCDGAGRLPATALERGVYRRDEVQAAFRSLAFPVQTSYGLPEFEGPGYRSELLVEGLLGIAGGRVRHAAAFNPGQGYVPAALWKLFEPESIALVDRDLLGLRCSRENLLRNGCDEGRVALLHQADLALPGREPLDLVAGLLREEEGAAAVAHSVQQAAARLAPGGLILAAGSSTAATRLEQAVRLEGGLRVKGRKRRKGNSLLALERR